MDSTLRVLNGLTGTLLGLFMDARMLSERALKFVTGLRILVFAR
jgi:hypothetical protein